MTIPHSTMVRFTKMVGTGNDFLIVDAVHQRLNSLKGRWPAIARAACDRRWGIGADGLLLLEPSRVGDVRMRVFNPDGSEAEMCGNGARCVVRFLAQRMSSSLDSARDVAPSASRGHGAPQAEPIALETAGGTVTGWGRSERIHLQMAEPTQVRLGLEIPVAGRMLSAASIDTGVPHVVVGVSDLEAVDVEGLGRQLRVHRMFQPRGTNVNFVQVDRHAGHCLRIRTYERGVEGETLACGTGVTAAAIIHGLTHSAGSNGGVRRRIDVITRGGDRMSVSFQLMAQGTRRLVKDVVLEGAVRWICDGTFRWPMGVAS
ncbi:MAG: diaminopimelate epimerase [Candidatus Omnitrophica bacterium]|nr:diaminopimelate epimerase [Candidatus Omnitrophota bacterium]